MMFQIFYSPYKLKFKKQPNSVSSIEYKEGCLIKIESDCGESGYSDLSTWPSLGDQPWEDELNYGGRIFNRALFLAYKDLIARKEKKSLINSSFVENNYLISSVEELKQLHETNSLSQLKNIKYKVKLSNDNYKDWVLFLNDESTKQKYLQSQCLRFDANACFSKKVFKKFVDSFEAEALHFIEYIEDPTKFDFLFWQEMQIKIKIMQDWEVETSNQKSHINETTNLWPHRVFKPTRDFIEDELKSPSLSSFALTSSMDHPVGLAHGLAYAQQYEQNTHGFLTLTLFEDNHYTKLFIQNKNKMSLPSNENGIGFTDLLIKENWIPYQLTAYQLDFTNKKVVESYLNSYNQNSFEFKFIKDFLSSIQSSKVLLNSRFSVDEKNELYSLVNHYLSTEKRLNHDQSSNLNDQLFFIPSSGSSQSQDQSIKLIVLTKSALLISAKRVVKQFQLTHLDHWACVLPLFHVGGLGIYFRTQLSQSKIFFSSWNQNQLSDFCYWLEFNKITCLSLVPTQIYDLIKQSIKAPKSLKYVFVGGAELKSDLALQAVNLGWPLVLTYGMTETASMIAYNDELLNLELSELNSLSHEDIKVKLSQYNLFDEVEISEFNNLLKVKSLSNAIGFLQKNRTRHEINFERFSDFIQTQDEIEIYKDQTFSFKQRKNEYIKVLGEGVSLKEIRDKWIVFFQNANNQLNLENTAIHAIFDERLNNKIILYVDIITDETQLKHYVENFNYKLLKPYERIKKIIFIKKIPKTDLFKIKYAELNQLPILKEIEL